MIKEKETIGLKFILAISCTAFLVLSSSLGIKSLIFRMVIAIALLPMIIKLPIKSENIRKDIKVQYLEAALLICIVMGYNFYKEWETSGKLQLIADTAGVSKKVILAVCCAVGMITSIPILVLLVNWVGKRYHNSVYKKSINSVFYGIKIENAALWLCTVYVVSLYPLFRADFNYIDDMGRVRFGYDDWGNFSRFLSNKLSHVIHGGDYLTDISPLTQLLAIAIIAAASIIVICQIRENKKFSLWDIITVIPLGLTPYFLECFSYKYDSPYMALSILASVAPVVLRKKGYKIYVVFVIIGTLAMCTTYQAASGIFPMLVVLLAYKMWLNKESTQNTLLFALVSSAAYLAGILIFRVFIMRPTDTYVSNSIGTISATFEHYKQYIKLVRTDFKRGWLLVIVALTLWFIVVTVYKSNRNKIVTMVLSTAVACIMFLLSFGLYPALSSPLYSPRAMYGVGAFIAFIGLGCTEDEKTQLVTRALTTVLAGAFVVFACTYGNALAVQNEYIDFRTTEVIDDLTDIETFNFEEDKSVEIIGNAGLSPVIENMSHGYNMLGRLIPQMFCQSWYWGRCKFMYYYDLDEALAYSEIEDVNSYRDWKILQESFYHKIYEKDGHYVVELK